MRYGIGLSTLLLALACGGGGTSREDLEAARAALSDCTGQPAPPIVESIGYAEQLAAYQELLQRCEFAPVG